MVSHRCRRMGVEVRAVAAVMAASLAAVWADPARAAQPTVESLPLAAAYGDGVHAYFAGDYHRAYEDLSQAIEAGTNDPRAYYFRGLAALRQGRGDEAEADFTTGADRESEGLGAWPVGRSLERIQGPDRLRLERHRTRARVAFLQRQREQTAARYSQIEEAQPEVLRQRRPVGPRVEAEDGGSPFREKAAPTPAPPEPMPAPAAEAPAAVEQPAPSAEQPAEDPFGDGRPSSP